MAILDTVEEKSDCRVGVDIGATLAKLAVRAPDGKLGFEFHSANDLPAVQQRIADLAPHCVGLTGCGAKALEARLDLPTLRMLEFEAWGLGSRSLLRAQGIDENSPYLLVSLGTGTSVLRVEGEEVSRVGGTALGGGTVLGLGVALTGCATHRAICRLAERGDRGRVDLRVGDIYEAGEIALPGETTAASFGNLARWLAQEPPEEADGGPDPSRPEDLAAAVMGLVGENVALICCGIAQATGIARLVYGGATLHENPALVATLQAVSAGMGNATIFLDEGSFAGAAGALERSANA